MYKNPTPVAVALIRVGDADIKLIAGRRNIEPFIGGLAFPGGYVNEGESAEVAVAREVYEEIGMVTEPGHWRPVLTRVTPDNKLLIFMRHIFTLTAEQYVENVRSLFIVANNFTPNAEVSELVLVDTGDTLCFPLHQELLDRKPLWE
jgi:ADP-ribose pyrophosphatase YjhB (NUDIX family)